MISSLVLFAVFCSLARASSPPRRTSMSLHGYVSSIPSGFVDNGPADPNSFLDLRIALVQGDSGGLIEALHNISTPGNPSFGQHLSSNETAKFTAPSPQAVAAVSSWLQGAALNASTITPARDWLQFNTTVSIANELLGANFSVFTHRATGEQVVRTLNYSVPTDLVGHIDFVHPTISVIALINVERDKANKRPLGFLNEFLYSNPQAFEDITAGANPGCGTGGFPAGENWDAVTGLGTPKFDALKTAALAW
ncbi:hypothetical protein NM688_g9316 [Phlebia brevispora]|uniref:Uncharacterized protein n=1 Tax=Phlebia brevispora TaxID=194682 RepID=A0ACC1RKJ6_9APHY|nr:hypothetical protein NM688_g9316 [Phlebia brevispora]